MEYSNRITGRVSDDTPSDCIKKKYLENGDKIAYLDKGIPHICSIEMLASCLIYPKLGEMREIHSYKPTNHRLQPARPK
jgi:hypothetical protein